MGKRMERGKIKKGRIGGREKRKASGKGKKGRLGEGKKGKIVNGEKDGKGEDKKRKVRGKGRTKG